MHIHKNQNNFWYKMQESKKCEVDKPMIKIREMIKWKDEPYSMDLFNFLKMNY